MKRTHNQYHFFIFLLTIFALEAILFSVGDFKANEAIRVKEQEIQKIKSALSNTTLLAKGVSVYDATDNISIYSKNADEKMPLASLAKTMTIDVALNEKDQSDMVVISESAINQAGDYGLLANEKWKVGDLAKFTLVGSANDGAYALAEDVRNFLEKMNTKAKKIGMEHTVFLNPTGLDINGDTIGAYASAYDSNIMAVFALRDIPDIFSATTLPEINFKSESGFEHNIKNTNVILDKIPNLLFSKTGYTDLTGGNLTVIFRNKNGHEIAVTILGSTFLGRFEDMEKIVNTLYNE